MRTRWNAAVERMAKQASARGKRQQLSLARKLREIPDPAVDQLLRSYYTTQKKKYYAVLSKWFARKKAIEVRPSDGSVFRRRRSRRLRRRRKRRRRPSRSHHRQKCP